MPVVIRVPVYSTDAERASTTAAMRTFADAVNDLATEYEHTQEAATLYLRALPFWESLSPLPECPCCKQLPADNSTETAARLEALQAQEAALDALAIAEIHAASQAHREALQARYHAANATGKLLTID